MANRLIYKFFSTENSSVDDEDSLVQYNEFDKDEFVDLISRTYEEKDLVKWLPAPVMPSDPDAPGNLGNCPEEFLFQ